MNPRTFNVVYFAAVLFVLGVQIRESNAIGNLKYGGVVGTIKPQGSRTTGPANALFSLIDNECQYVFVTYESYVAAIGVHRANYVGQPGSSATLEIHDQIGFISIADGIVFFISIVDQPFAYIVPNDNSTVPGYKNLHGYLLYQVFEALAADCDYKCTACPMSILNDDPSEVSNTRGKMSINFQNIQSVSVVCVEGEPFNELYKEIDSTLSRSQTGGYYLQKCKQCVNVIKTNPFLLSCPVKKDNIFNSPLAKGALYSLKTNQPNNGISGYIFSQAAVLVQQSQSVFSVHRAIIPTICKSVAVVSFYTSPSIFQSVALTVFDF